METPDPYSYYDDDDDDDEEDNEEDQYLIPKPSEWFPKLVSLQADLIYNSILVLCRPIISLFSLAYESYHQAEKAKVTIESAVQKAPSTVTHGVVVLFKKLALGFLGAAYVRIVLLMLLILAAIMGVALVRLWLEEPVVVRERLHFDYTQAHPNVVFVFGGSSSLHRFRPTSLTLPIRKLPLPPCFQNSIFSESRSSEAGNVMSSTIRSSQALIYYSSEEKQD